MSVLYRYVFPSEKCVLVHWHLPYRWQVLDIDGVAWKDLPNMEDIEKAYCDPENDKQCVNLPQNSSVSRLTNWFLTISLKSWWWCTFSSLSSAVPSVDFLTMRYGGSQVRRLSTASSVSKPPNFILTTEWVWYWKDDGGRWQEFGQVSQTCRNQTAMLKPNKQTRHSKYKKENHHWGTKNNKQQTCGDRYDMT